MKLFVERLRNNDYLPHSMAELSVFILCVLFFAIRDITVLLYAGQIFSYIYIFIIINKRRINYTYTTIWVPLILWSFLSILWARNQEHAVKFIREIIQVAVLTILLFLCCQSNKKNSKIEMIDMIIRYICTSSVIMLVYFLYKTPLSVLIRSISTNASYERFGETIGLNPNALGNLCAISCSCWLYQWRKGKNAIKLIFALMIFILMLFTQSRGSLLMFAIIVVTYHLIEAKLNYKIILRILLIILLLYAVIWIFLNVKFLYRIIGFRIEGLLSLVFRKEIVDASVNGRYILINAGKEIIHDYPVFGVGAGNYSNTAYSGYGIWRDVYAHNNYIEIWADLGIVGFLIYYVPRFICLLRLISIKQQIKDKTQLQLLALLLALMLSILVSDYFKISYNNEPAQIVFMLSYLFSKDMIKKKGKIVKQSVLKEE